jgi:hypothetical protein
VGGGGGMGGKTNSARIARRRCQSNHVRACSVHASREQATRSSASHLAHKSRTSRQSRRSTVTYRHLVTAARCRVKVRCARSVRAWGVRWAAARHAAGRRARGVRRGERAVTGRRAAGAAGLAGGSVPRLRVVGRDGRSTRCGGARSATALPLLRRACVRSRPAVCSRARVPAARAPCHPAHRGGPRRLVRLAAREPPPPPPLPQPHRRRPSGATTPWTRGCASHSAPGSLGAT